MPAVEPLQEGEEVTDTTGKKWKLVKLLSQSTTELIYEGETWYMTSGQIILLLVMRIHPANTYTVKCLKADTTVVKEKYI